MCVVTRSYGNRFGDVSQVAFAIDGGPPGPSATVVQSAVGVQLFFVPQLTELPPANELALLATGERLELADPLTFTEDSMDGARSLRTQMDIMQQTMAAFISTQRAAGTTSGDLLPIYLAAMGDASLRLADRLDGMIFTAPPTDSVGFEDIVNGLVSENQARMDDFLSTAFSF